MHLGQLRPPRGAKHPKKRIGRGNASGQGTYAGKGLKGQQARSGKKQPYAGFEGGQWPLIRKLARRGFTNALRVEYEEVKVGELEGLPADAEITPELLAAAGIVKRPQRPVKVLSNGDVSRPLTVRAHRFTAAARQKIEAAGGTVIEMNPGKRAAAAATEE